MLFASQTESLDGLGLALGIAMHNVGEGFACAAAAFGATRSLWRAVGLAALSGLAEPASVLVGHVLLSSLITPTFVAVSLAVCGGIMGALAMFELLPLAMRGAESEWKASFCAGMVAGALPLVWLERLV